MLTCDEEELTNSEENTTSDEEPLSPTPPEFKKEIGYNPGVITHDKNDKKMYINDVGIRNGRSLCFCRR